MPNAQLLFGPLLIGVFLSTVLYGILLLQSFIYFRTYRKDSARCRYFVLFLVLCDTLNTVFDIGIIYEPLVFRYGTSRATERVPILLPLNPLMTAIISTSVQLFLCWRIKMINNSWIIPGFISVFIFSSFVGGVATCICGALFVDFVRLERFDGAAIAWLISSAIADISITVSVVISLARRRTGNTITDNAIDRSIRLTIHTGAVTALFATMDMALFVGMPNSSLNFAFGFPLAKLYTNSLLSTLNARGGWYSTAQERLNDNVLYGPSSWNTSNVNDNCRETERHNRKSIMFSNVFAKLSSPPPAVSPTRHQPQGERTFSIDLESAADDINGDTSPKADLTTTGSIPAFNIPALV